MDIEQLIKEVQRRPAIWDQKCIQYYNREVVNKTWKEIANACGMPCEAVRCKWKHLRDNFRKEFKKSIKERNENPGNPDGYQSGWVWFNSLRFLGEQLSTKKLILNQKSSSDTSKDGAPQNEDLDTPETTEDQDDSNLMINDSHYSQSMFAGADTDSDAQEQYLQHLISASKKRLYYDAFDSDTEVKSKKLIIDHMFNREKDDTYHFLMSLLTPLKSLPFSRQMFVRLKMQELICNEFANNHHVPFSQEYNKSNSLTNIQAIMDGSNNNSIS